MINVIDVKAKEIANLRKRLGLTQTKFAKEVGATQETVSRWETGVFDPVGSSLKVLKDLAKPLGNSVRERNVTRDHFTQCRDAIWLAIEEAEIIRERHRRSTNAYLVPRDLKRLSDLQGQLERLVREIQAMRDQYQVHAREPRKKQKG
jgi:transcriptional regulator with XRE-family HTH domain